MVEEEDLGRFAGSSAEEDNNDVEENEASDHSEDEDEDEAVAMKPAPDHGYEVPADVEDSSDDESDAKEKTQATADRDGYNSSDDDEDGGPKAAGLANAMARILGSAAYGTKGTKPMVLSKTTTRIQKQAAEEREQIKEMKEKRLHNRERDLQAVHIPLSVATSHQVTNKSKALVKELEMERVHRRVATRGVVALFNAIAQHQNQATKDKESTFLLSSSKKTDVKKMTKHSFLDMIKNKAVEKSASPSDKPKGEEAPQWKALQDDYMLNPKKNWDQESSDEEEENDEIEKNSPKKKRKTARS